MAKTPRTDTARKAPSAPKKTGTPKTQSASSAKPERKSREIAGVKVPKDLREVAAAAQKLMENPLVREVVTAGVMAAMAAFAEAQQESKEKKAQRAAGGGDTPSEDLKATAKSTAKVIASAAAGAMGKRIVSEVKTRGPELLAKFDGGNGSSPAKDQRSQSEDGPAQDEDEDVDGEDRIEAGTPEVRA